MFLNSSFFIDKKHKMTIMQTAKNVCGYKMLIITSPIKTNSSDNFFHLLPHLLLGHSLLGMSYIFA